MSHEELLQEIGLTQNEAHVYLALLGLGMSAPVRIVKKSGLHKATVYNVLERLVKKGIVSYIKKEETTLYKAEKPESLLELLRLKELKLRNALPEFLIGLDTTSTKVIVHEGINAVRNKLKALLTHNKPILVYGIPLTAVELMKYFIDQFHQERIGKKIPMLHIYNEEAQQRIKYLNKLPHTQARYLPRKYNSPISTQICGNEVDFILWTKNPLVIEIQSQELAESYQKYFELLWKLAKK